MRRISHHFHVFFSYLLYLFVSDKKKKESTLIFMNNDSLVAL